MKSSLQRLLHYPTRLLPILLISISFSAARKYPMFHLQPFTQNYAWGKRGNDSLVGSLVQVDESKRDTPYAELWMGTHPSGPCKIRETSELLSSWLRANPSAVGRTPLGYETNDLPFLFKVLSIEKALSIQAHPDKDLARRLHQERPTVYKDPNHKPEMVIALTEFRCMCGFRAVEEIAQLATQFPEFVSLLQEKSFDIQHIDEHYLRSLFRHYMTSDAAIVKVLLTSLVTRLKAKTSPPSLVEETILLLHEQFPGDIGVFAPILLNCLILRPGDSFFIGANEPHAYVQGDCIECMALSDNVVRAGLTDKLKDVETLCNMLTYRSGIPDFVAPLKQDEVASLYRPSYQHCSEFAVEKIDLTPEKSYRLLNQDISSIILVLEGSVTLASASSSLTAHRGDIVFVAAGEATDVTNLHNSSSLLFRAHVNLDIDR